MTMRTRGERRYELVVMAVAVLAVVFRSIQWHTGPPDLNVVAIIALLLVPVAVRTQITISRGQTELTLGAAAAVLFAADVERQASILPIWAVLVAASYLVFHRDETAGQFRAAIQVLGGAVLLRVAEITDVGYPPFDRVFAGLAAYFLVISALEIVRSIFAAPTHDGHTLRLRWTWTFIVGLAVFYIGCVFAALRRVEAGIPLPVMPSFVVAMLGLTAVVVGLTMRNVELNRSVTALSGAAVAMPWRREQIDESLSTWGAQGLRVEKVVVSDDPGSGWDLSVPLTDGRYVVAERTSGDLPFTQVERHVLEALANMADTARREAAQIEGLQDRANTDGLTGLSTYTYFREILAEVSRSRRPGESIAIVFIDLDGFKEINDRYGHIAGDAAIQELAQRLIAHTGGARSVTRYGGDEFAVLVRDVRDYAELTVECDRLTRLIAEPVLVGRSTLRLRASIGSALSSSADDNLEALVRAADQQMYQRKRAVHAGDSEVTSRIDEAVRHAITSGSLWTAYQPIINLQIDEVRGLEALVRCTDPQMGSIPPPVIVESAIRLNLLDDMTLLVLDQAVASMLACREHVPELAVFSINLELEQMLVWSPLMQRLADCRAVHGLTVVVEISEGSIGEWSDANAEVARRLQDAGAQIAIDDFGSGFAGLGSLYLPRVDIVKLDRSLLTDLADPRQTLVVTRATSLLNELGFWVVAEGITRPDEVPVLRDAGATHVQGYLYGMAEDLATTLQRFRQHGLKPLVDTSTV
ncbi:EAL domain-containing protein [Aeromicrobium stalagmiti]|uniref:EAL domain-containing protein n=1 Tax=Aeromicrobium stalagmiti TaxID=2738988 RepID=UPI00156892CA|nr:EAL domain-containing protein [Aeromicrobium stalagmiti]NRQ48274.1 EAL domain-containing protein [Aeromicrobium stalagmiti]